MKNKVVIGIAMLLLVMVAFSGCIDEETPKSTGNSILPTKTALQPGVYDISELSHLPMTINLGNDTYLVLTDADKERISGYFENKGIFFSAFVLEVIFRDKSGKVVNNGVQKISVQKEEELFLRRKVPVHVEIPLDFFETWEVRGSSIRIPYSNILDVGRSQEVKLNTRVYDEEDFVELKGTIDVKHSGKDTVTATLIGKVESKSNKKLIANIGFQDINNSVYAGMENEQRGQLTSTFVYLYLEPLERRTFEAQFSTPAYETDELFRLNIGASEYRQELPAEVQDRIV